jgi:hypothetical protein
MQDVIQGSVYTDFFVVHTILIKQVVFYYI